jgi:hypothetical protein
LIKCNSKLISEKIQEMFEYQKTKLLSYSITINFTLIKMRSELKDGFERLMIEWQMIMKTIRND